MAYPENIILKAKNGVDISIRPYLTVDETLAVIGGCISAYDNGLQTIDGETVTDDIPDWDKSIVLMERNFYKLLIELCTDIDTTGEFDYDELLAWGILDDIYREIINAKDTLNKIYDIINKRDSLEYIVDRGINKLLEKLPTQKELNGLYSKLKKDLTSGKLDKSLSNIKEIFDIKN